MNPKLKSCVIRTLLVSLGLILWFATQSLIAVKAPSKLNQDLAAKVLTEGDLSFQITAPLHQYLLSSPEAAKTLLISSSLGVDLLGLYLLLTAIFGSTLRPFLSLLVIFTLRQICQFTVSLPIPENMIWFDPGFPSLFVTYGVSNDFFFSGHTAISIIGACELARRDNKALLIVATLISIFEISTVITLRAHYFMDVFTALSVAFLVNAHSNKLANPIDRFIEKFNK